MGAAIEAGFLGLRGIVVSLYPSVEENPAFARTDHAEAGRVTTFLLRHSVDARDRRAFDYLKVNVPADRTAPRMRITEPTY